ncbi:MAG TPA: hypothetical protein VIK13_11945, partial [Candidatus Limnocylindrales bacterium]
SPFVLNEMAPVAWNVRTLRVLLLAVPDRNRAVPGPVAAAPACARYARDVRARNSDLFSRKWYTQPRGSVNAREG